jgi:hypothetical protein
VVIGIGTMAPRFAMRVGHNRCMAKAHYFKLALTRVIEPTGGGGADLATLEDAARFVGLVRPWRQARPHWEDAAELLKRRVRRGCGRGRGQTRGCRRRPTLGRTT